MPLLRYHATLMPRRHSVVLPSMASPPRYYAAACCHDAAAAAAIAEADVIFVVADMPLRR